MNLIQSSQRLALTLIVMLLAFASATASRGQEAVQSLRRLRRLASSKLPPGPRSSPSGACKSTKWAKCSIACLQK